MPTVLFINGWRFFFFADEGNEPVHIHVEKAEKSCKFFIDAEKFDLNKKYSKNMNNSDLKQVKEIIFSNFNYIVDQWEKFQRKRK